jgi:DMSO reductase family type II enzyme heme b subunit
MRAEKGRIRIPELTPRVQAVAILAALLILGGVLSALNVPLAASAANSVRVERIPEEIPLDPRSELWERAEEAEIAMSAQQIYQPGGGSTRAVRISALENGQDVAIRMTWEDSSKNDTLGDVPTDAAAIQLPIDPTHLPYQCMGQSTSKVNIWHWKAAWEREVREMLGSSPLAVVNQAVRNYTSNGICKAVETPGIAPEVQSYHDGQRWFLVYKRSLNIGDAGTAPLDPTLPTSIAFAVWNGAQGEVRGMKAVTTWNTLAFETVEKSNMGDLVTLGVVILASIGIMIFAMRRFAG